MTYTVRGKNELGCFGEDSVTVFFFKEGDQKLFMPTAFTPNGDGKNEIFRPTFVGPYAKYDFKIYNRWGQLVYESKVPGAGWDGTLNGVPQKADVYVFYIAAEGGCNGKFVQKGTFALIR
jgi:gliding motility-associated-like protein